MTPAQRAEALARVLHDHPVPDTSAAVIELLLMCAIDIVRTSPGDQADRLAAIARALG